MRPIIFALVFALLCTPVIANAHPGHSLFPQQISQNLVPLPSVNPWPAIYCAVGFALLAWIAMLVFYLRLRRHERRAQRDRLIRARIMDRAPDMDELWRKKILSVNENPSLRLPKMRDEWR